MRFLLLFLSFFNAKTRDLLRSMSTGTCTGTSTSNGRTLYLCNEFVAPEERSAPANIASVGNYSVYLLVNTSNNCTYIGSTNNLIRRLRQHNGELVGGARYTTAKRMNGMWQVHGVIERLERRQALSIEKRIQLRSKKSSGKTPLLRRLRAIENVLQEFSALEFKELPPR